LSERLHFRFIEKAIVPAFNLEKTEYIEQRESLKNHSKNDSDVMALFFGLNNILCAKESVYSSVVADRYLITNYFWYGNSSNLPIYRALLEVGGKPELTVVLDADVNTLTERILNRGSMSPKEIEKEIEKAKRASEFVPKVQVFLKDMGMDYLVIDTTQHQVEEIVDIIIEHLTSR